MELDLSFVPTAWLLALLFAALFGSGFFCWRAAKAFMDKSQARNLGVFVFLGGLFFALVIAIVVELFLVRA